MGVYYRFQWPAQICYFESQISWILVTSWSAILHIADLTPIGMAHQFEKQRDAYCMYREDGSEASSSK